MAKKKAKAGITLILVAIVLAVVLTPIFFIVSTIWNFIRLFVSYIRYSVLGNGVGYTEDELVYIEDRRMLRRKLSNEKDRIITEGVENGVSRNVDGSFSRRSDVGKDLSRRLQENEVNSAKTINDIEVATSIVERRCDSVYAPLVRFLSYLIATVSWFLYLVFALKLDDVSIEVLLQPYYEIVSLVIVFILMLGSGTAQPETFKAIIDAVMDSMSVLGVAFLVPIVTYFIFKIVLEVVFKR